MLHLYGDISYSSFVEVNSSKNVEVATSNEALLDRPPPKGTVVKMHASNPGMSPE